MEFEASKKEIRRRKKAFATLVASVSIGLFLASNILRYPISKSGYLSIAVIFLVIGVLTFLFLNSISKVRLRLFDEKIERMNAKAAESFFFSEISGIKVKRRTSGAIREIYIWFDNKKSLFLTAFEENFENIKDILADKTRKNVAVKESREPIDFDHPLFYSLLGLVVSFFGVYFLKLVSSADSSQAKIIIFACAVFLFFLGAYFIFAKPISARYEGKRAAIDYAIGIFMVCAGIFISFAELSL
jgi:ABC-type multidrug transport system fused ATPase/permease subunit